MNSISEPGRDLKGRKLNEDNLDSSIPVIYQGKRYTTGNRRHDLVELYRGKKFFKIVSMGEIRVIEQTAGRGY